MICVSAQAPGVRISPFEELLLALFNQVATKTGTCEVTTWSYKVKLSGVWSSIEELNEKKARFPSVEFESPGFGFGQTGYERSSNAEEVVQIMSLSMPS